MLEGTKLDPNLGPVFGTIGAETHEQGGYAFHAHGGYAQEIWADLVQGATNGVELLQFGIYRGIGLEGWYHVLNAGFRFPGVGACDYPACRKLGDCRTYVHIDGEPTFPELARRRRARPQLHDHRPAGRCWTSTASGPATSSPPRRRAAIASRRASTVHSETAPVTDVQLIVNGRVVARS